MCGTSNLTGPKAHNIIYPYNIPIIYINSLENQIGDHRRLFQNSINSSIIVDSKHNLQLEDNWYLV